MAARRGPSARSTTPICASRRASSGGACTIARQAAVAPSGNTGSDGSSAAPAQRIGADVIDRRIEIVAERGAERLLVALARR